MDLRALEGEIRESELVVEQAQFLQEANAARDEELRAIWRRESR